MKIDGIDEEVRNAVIDKTNGLTDRSSHELWPFRLSECRFSYDDAFAPTDKHALRSRAQAVATLIAAVGVNSKPY